MAKAVFTHKEQSRYDDRPESRYQFPRTYLNQAEKTVGDWIVYYEPRRTEGERAGGRQAYFAAARVTDITPDPRDDGLFIAHMDDFLPLPAPPRFETDGAYFESALQKADGSTNKGLAGRAIRLIPDHEFEAIIIAGMADLQPALKGEDWIGAERLPPIGFEESQAPFERPIIERLTSRPYRDAAFARQVKAAYANTCAMTGLAILNGGGRPEVQAAHIRPVADNGPDSVRNGLALSGTAHWMFDRGLVSIDDDYTILIAKDRLPDAATRLIREEKRLLLPGTVSYRPHPAYLAHHRNNYFKG